MHYETVGWIFKDLLLLDFLHSCILDLCYYGFDAPLFIIQDTPHPSKRYFVNKWATVMNKSCATCTTKSQMDLDFMFLMLINM